MRNGWREILWLPAFLSICGGALAARNDPTGGADRPVRLTLEVAWSSPPNADAATLPAPEVELELSEGSVSEAIAWPTGPGPERRGDRHWRLGAERSGRVRARLEVPVGASLILRAGGQAMRFPVASILEGPQRTPPQSPVEVVVERLPWDAISVSFGEGAESGVVAPGSKAPLSIGFNVITPEPTQVVVQGSAVLRPVAGGPPVWRADLREVVPTNATAPPAYALSVPVPAGEQTYVLEVRAQWGPATPPEPGSLIGRLIRRGSRGAAVGSGSASRRVTLAAVSAEPPPEPGPPVVSRAEPDSVELSKLRNNRPTASGRAPLPGPGREDWALPNGALAESTRRDLLGGWMTRVGSEVSELGPAGPSGLAWSAVGLKVARPGRPHRLVLTVTGGHPAALGVAVVGPPGPPGPAVQRPRLLLDACASGPPILPEGPAATFSWLVWPDTADPVLVLVNRSSASPVRVGTVTLGEVADLPPAPPVAAPPDAKARALGLAMTGPDVLDRFGLRVAEEPGLSDPLRASRELARYVAHAGASLALLSDNLSDRDRRRALDGQAAEDGTGPDRLDLALRVLGRRKLSAWLELGLTGALPGLPAPGTAEALAKGLVRLDRRGQADGPSPTYHPLHPEVRDALKRTVAEAAASRGPEAPVAGLLIRLGRGPTLLGAPDTGLDDATFGQFVREAFEAGAAGGLPGSDNADPGRFGARAEFLAGPARMPWLTWRSKRVASLYGELAEAAAGASPGVALAVVTPGLSEGPAGAEARRADLSGLDPSLAWRAVGLDLESWPTGKDAPVTLRGIGLGPDPLARDLATHPELDAKVAGRPSRGTFLDGPDAPLLSLKARPMGDGPEGDEPLGHALAALDARYALVDAGAAAGHEERLRRFGKIFHALPASEGPAGAAPPLPFGASARAHAAGDATYLALANDTPYPVRLDAALVLPAVGATFDDLGRGARLKPSADAAGHHVVLDLLPFGVAVIRVSAPGVKVGSVTPYPPAAVLATLQARFDELSDQLARLTQRHEPGRAGPPNPGFEPEVSPTARVVPLSVGAANPPAGAPVAAAVAGWQASGGAGCVLHIDPSQRRTGLGSLRLDAPEAPGAAVSEAFSPAASSSLIVRAWLRSDQPGAKVRLWIEGEAGGEPYRRVSELTSQPAWAERAVRAGDFPGGVLDTVRLRFELLSPGSLWVDDLTVTGASLSEPERRNARNALVAAIQAYREKRYADFARLAGSRWARLPTDTAPTPAPPPAVAEGPAADDKGARHR